MATKGIKVIKDIREGDTKAIKATVTKGTKVIKGIRGIKEKATKVTKGTKEKDTKAIKVTKVIRVTKRNLLSVGSVTLMKRCRPPTNISLEHPQEQQVIARLCGNNLPDGQKERTENFAA